MKQEEAHPLHSLGPSSFIPPFLSSHSFSFYSCDPPSFFFFFEPRWQEQGKPLSSFLFQDEHPGTTSADHCSQSLHKRHQAQILSCLWTSERKKSLPIWSKCQVITFNMKQKHESQGKYIPDCYNLMNTRIESIWRHLFFHSHWGDLQYWRNTKNSI